MSQLTKEPPKPRDPPPPPNLFHPSPTASHASLPGMGLSGASGPPPFTSPPSIPALNNPLRGGGLNINLTHHPLPPIQLRRESSTRATDRTDALWAEMQATLEEVDQLSAGGVGGGGGGAQTTTGSRHAARIFGPEHERKLDELRAAQIALAQAWARSEADEAIETVGGAAAGGGAGAAGATGEGAGAASEGAGVGAGVGKSVGTAGRSVGTTIGRGPDGGGTATDGGHTRSTKSTVGTGARPGSSGGQEKVGDKLEEETEVDILLARKRREANDRYFQRVNQGVLDVVAKLEEVAIAMRAVEQESKELWDDENESVPGSAKA
ncbi:hypothetical protein MFIFM68171_03580 [Madurella fahalii]|uniref:Uncharacterized protein n=1 Tax=Madurella fahalii TaxID=1157608 RepID=A0ABQ0G6J1_9PEZI